MIEKKRRNKARTASLKYEAEYFRNGYTRIVGIDEAGRGPLAGPIMVGAVALPLQRRDLSGVLRGVRDSKQMTSAQRELLSEVIREVALSWGVGEASAEEISTLNLNGATRLAVSRALEDMQERSPDFEPDALFVDYMAWPPPMPIHQLSIVKGDQHSLSIAAASVLAKVTRDAWMVDVAAAEFPHYGFEKHKGYGTEEHIAALKQYGVTPLHRTNFAPIRDVIAGREPGSWYSVADDQ